MSLPDEKYASTRALVAYLEQELPASEARLVEQQLKSSADAGRRLEQILAVRDHLSAPLPTLEGLDLRAGVRGALSARPQPKRDGERLRARLSTLLAAAACLAALVIPSLDLGSELRAKSAGAVKLAGAVAARLEAYVLVDGKQVMPLVGTMERSSGLLFSYTNQTRDPYRYLMVFAVDASNEVRWFYPAFTDVRTDPTSISIGAGQVRTMLPDVVRHELSPGSMSIHALFTRRPLRVSEVEGWVSRGRDGDWPLARGEQSQRLSTVVSR